MDLVSIIVPVYNVEQYLHECVDSILAQTYKNIEVILVDDGSHDGSPQICDEYASKDSRVCVIHKSNGGLSDARNFGLDVAKGKYVNFCDSDDKIDPIMIETLVNLQKQYNIDVIECESVFYFGDREEIIPHYHKDDGIYRYSVHSFMSDLLLIKADCSVCNKLFIRSQFNKFRFAVGKYNEDILLLFDFLSICNGIIHINKGFYKYRETPGSISRSFNERSLDLFYNTLSIRDLIYSKYPELKKDADLLMAAD